MHASSHIARKFFQSWIQPVAVVVNFSQVVVSNQAGTLSGGMPGGTRSQLTFLDQNGVGATFFCQVLEKRHTHNAATHYDYFCLASHNQGDSD